jgi:hypothetical protein
MLLLCLALFLPLQLAWAGAAAYCEHTEPASQASHFGHHSHPQCEAAPNTPDGSDTDCEVCHSAAGRAILLSAVHPASDPSSLSVRFADIAQGFVSALSRQPDRPQWLLLT